MKEFQELEEMIKKSPRATEQEMLYTLGVLKKGFDSIWKRLDLTQNELKRISELYNALLSDLEFERKQRAVLYAENQKLHSVIAFLSARSSSGSTVEDE
jgi:hypothetical protein